MAGAGQYFPTANDRPRAMLQQGITPAYHQLGALIWRALAPRLITPMGLTACAFPFPACDDTPNAD